MNGNVSLGVQSQERSMLGRRKFSTVLGAGVSALLVGSKARGAAKGRVEEEEVAHTCETIHQTVSFQANPKRVYEALMDEKQFDKVVKASLAMQSGMALGNEPTRIARELGGTFTLFGGHIIGRHLELVPGKRIVQAWRVATWDEGVYSIARFELSEEGTGTKLVFDHQAFPSGQGQHLAEGWRGNYWEPLAKIFQ